MVKGILLKSTNYRKRSTILIVLAYMYVCADSQVKAPNASLPVEVDILRTPYILQGPFILASRPPSTNTFSYSIVSVNNRH